MILCIVEDRSTSGNGTLMDYTTTGQSSSREFGEDITSVKLLQVARKVRSHQDHESMRAEVYLTHNVFLYYSGAPSQLNNCKILTMYLYLIKDKR